MIVRTIGHISKRWVSQHSSVLELKPKPENKFQACCLLLLFPPTTPFITHQKQRTENGQSDLGMGIRPVEEDTGGRAEGKV